jgi:hypothetical protein
LHEEISVIEKSQHGASSFSQLSQCQCMYDRYTLQDHQNRSQSQLLGDEIELNVETELPTLSLKGSVECDQALSVPNRLDQSDTVSVLAEADELAADWSLAAEVGPSVLLTVAEKSEVKKPNIYPILYGCGIT